MVMSILGIIAVGISIRISVTMVRKQDQMLKTKPVTETGAVKSVDISVNLNKAAEQDFYLNGRQIKGGVGYLTGKDRVFLPLDPILQETGSNFRWFGSDDMLEASFGGENLLLKFGEGISLGGRKLSLQLPPFTAKGHIYVTAELFDSLDGFRFDGYAENNSVFLNYYPDFEDRENSGIRVLRLREGTAALSDISGERSFWDRADAFSQKEGFFLSSNGFSGILKSGDRTYLIKYGNTVKPRLLDTDPSAVLSADGKYLYWTDNAKKQSCIQDLRTGRIKKPGDYFKTVIEGNAVYSPDGSKVLFFRKSKGYYVANSDGTGITFLGNGIKAEWINNNRIFIDTGSIRLLFSGSGKPKGQTKEVWRSAGRTSAGDIFFTKGNELFCEAKGKEKFLIQLPWECSYIFAASVGGPYLAASEKQDMVYFIDGGDSRPIGSFSRLLKENINDEVKVNYLTNFSASPDNRHFVIFRNNSGFAAFMLVNRGEEQVREIVLNYRIGEEALPETLISKWLTADRLLIYNRHRGWVIDMQQDIKISDWTEQAGTTIEGIFP